MLNVLVFPFPIQFMGQNGAMNWKNSNVGTVLESNPIKVKEDTTQ